MSKKISLGLSLTITLLAMTATISITMLLSMRIFDGTVTAVTEKETMNEKLTEIDTLVRNNYLHEINDQFLLDMIGTGYVTGLGDSATRYMTTRQYTEYLDIQSGRIVGIGADVVKDAAGYLRVVRVYPESPAANAAMEPGSVIKFIDDVDVRTISITAGEAMLRGATGSETKLVWSAYNSVDDNTTVLLRNTYVTPAIEYSLQNTDTGYIDVLRFSSTLATEMQLAVDNLTASGATGFIIDVRGITETEFDFVADVVDVFITSGVVAELEYYSGETETLLANDSRSNSAPVVMLIDENTAGAPELFAQAMKTMNDASIVGVTTAGLGTSSDIFPLSDGSALSLTVAMVKPNGAEAYNGIGVVPDFEAVLTEEQKLISYELTLEVDPQYLRGFDMLDVMRTELGIPVVEPTSSLTPILPPDTSDSDTSESDTSNSDISDSTDTSETSDSDTSSSSDGDTSDASDNSDS